MTRYANDFICRFMNIYENMIKSEKMVEKLRGCTYNIAYMSDANYSRLPNLVPNKVETYHLNTIV